MKNVNPGKLKRLVDHFVNRQILVIGDVMLDEYIWGKVTRISPEAPIPVVHVTRENCLPGGAANVANNIRALGGRVLLAGILGRDAMAERVIRLLRKEGVDTSLLLQVPGRPTITKTRVIAHSQQVVRIDREHPGEISGRLEAKLLEGIERAMRRVDAVVVSDYNKGLLTASLMEQVMSMAHRLGKIITGDPKPENIRKFRGVTLISPNKTETEKAAGISIVNDASLKKAGRKILEDLDCDAVLVTRGEEGMSLFERQGEISHIPTVAQEVFDVSGAGDTVISTLTLALSAGASLKEAAVAANCAAGITVGEVGVATCTREQLKRRIGEEPWK